MDEERPTLQLLWDPDVGWAWNMASSCSAHGILFHIIFSSLGRAPAAQHLAYGGAAAAVPGGWSATDQRVFELERSLSAFMQGVQQQLSALATAPAVGVACGALPRAT